MLSPLECLVILLVLGIIEKFSIPLLKGASADEKPVHFDPNKCNFTKLHRFFRLAHFTDSSKMAVSSLFLRDSLKNINLS